MVFSYISINKYAATPLYEQLRRCIAEAIRKSVLKPGDKLPTEDELSAAFEISRPVGRQAYGELVRNGAVVRERGKGTFVKAENYGVFMNKLMSYQEELALTGHIPHTSVLSLELCRWPADLLQELGATPEAECFHLERLRSTDDKPSVHLETFLPAARFPGLDRFDFARFSLYQTLRREYGVHLSYAKRSLWAENAAPEIAAHLCIENGAALLVLRSLTYDQNDHLVEVSFERFAGNTCRYEFEVNKTAD